MTSVMQSNIHNMHEVKVYLVRDMRVPSSDSDFLVGRAVDSESPFDGCKQIGGKLQKHDIEQKITLEVPLALPKNFSCFKSGGSS